MSEFKKKNPIIKEIVQNKLTGNSTVNVQTIFEANVTEEIFVSKNKFKQFENIKNSYQKNGNLSYSFDLINEEPQWLNYQNTTTMLEIRGSNGGIGVVQTNPVNIQGVYAISLVLLGDWNAQNYSGGSIYFEVFINNELFAKCSYNQNSFVTGGILEASSLDYSKPYKHDIKIEIKNIKITGTVRACHERYGIMAQNSYVVKEKKQRFSEGELIIFSKI